MVRQIIHSEAAEVIASIFSGRVRLLLSKGHSCYRPRRTGERKRKSVRGCIVDGNLSVLALVIVRKGEQVSFKRLFNKFFLYMTLLAQRNCLCREVNYLVIFVYVNR